MPPGNSPVTDAGLAALAQPETPASRLQGVAVALTDLRNSLDIYARTGKLTIATDLLGELVEEVTEVATDVRSCEGFCLAWSLANGGAAMDLGGRS